LEIYRIASGSAARRKADMRTLGWDVGGAHLKAALAENGAIVKVWQEPTPIWKGLHHLADALASILGKVGPVDRHAVTMTGELSDIFADRDEGVRELTRILSERTSASMPAAPVSFPPGGSGSTRRGSPRPTGMPPPR
jgi:uncharacterized hydantoinase/oxoprolinase family protein